MNVNLEAAVDERTADLQEANEEIQRFAYIVSHDLRSPLVNIMGFTSELEELRGSIFQRLARLSAPQTVTAGADARAGRDRALADEDKELAEEFDESLSFIKSSIGKMDRLIAAILTLTREGRREFKPERIDVHELIEGIAKTVAHQAEEANADDQASTRCRSRQRPAGARADLLEPDRQRAEIPEAGRARRDSRHRAAKNRLHCLRSDRQRPRDRPEGSPADFRPVSPGRRAGSSGPGHWAGPCPRAGAADGRNAFGFIGAWPGQHLHGDAADQMDFACRKERHA